MIGFGMIPLKKEGEVIHPEDGRVKTDKNYLKQLQAYADWRGIDETKKEICSRPYLLNKLKVNK